MILTEGRGLDRDDLDQRIVTLQSARRDAAREVAVLIRARAGLVDNAEISEEGRRRQIEAAGHRVLQIENVEGDIADIVRRQTVSAGTAVELVECRRDRRPGTIGAENGQCCRQDRTCASCRDKAGVGVGELIAAEEEELVFDDRAAECEAELSAVSPRFFVAAFFEEKFV